MRWISGTGSFYHWKAAGTLQNQCSTILVKEEMLNKLGFVAEYEGRSLNSHILVLIRDSIREHGAKFGEIDGKVEPGSSVKPPRKG
jgi:hypothetical protein